MNTKQYTIDQAWAYADGLDVKDGWDLFCNGNWCQRFWYKRDALAAMREAKAEDRASQPTNKQFLAAIGPCGK